jgi:plastocyanin
MRKLLSALAIALALILLGLQSAQSAQDAPTVHMSDFAFHPQSLSVHTGDTVIFQNDDDVTHNVSTDAFKSPDIEGGKSWKYTFSKAGTYAYVCTYHPGMKGTITVSDQ